MRDAVAIETAEALPVTGGDARREEALRRLAAGAARRGHRIAYDLLGSRADAEDAVQEALSRAAVAWDRLRDPGALEGWFLKVLTNHCMRTLRRRRLGRGLRALWGGRLVAAPTGADEAGEPPELDAADDAPGADESLGAARDAAAVLAAVGDLPPMQRAAVVLRYGHDVPVAEIAEMLGVGAGTVKTHLVRGLERLRARMAPGARVGGAGTAAGGAR